MNKITNDFYKKVKDYYESENKLVFECKFIKKIIEKGHFDTSEEGKYLVDKRNRLHVLLNFKHKNHSICFLDEIEYKLKGNIRWVCFDNNNCTNKLRNVKELLDY